MDRLDHGLRACLRIIRDQNTTPDFVLPNGLSAGQTALLYVYRLNIKRNNVSNLSDAHGSSEISA